MNEEQTRWEGGQEYYTRRTVQPKRSNALGNIAKVGCGCVFGAFASIMFLILMGRAFYINNIVGGSAADSSLQEDSAEQPMPAQRFKVRTRHSKGTIYIGMPKDSVIMVLGQPDEFGVSDNYDQITYYRNSYGTNRINISFEDGRIESVDQY